MNNDCVDELNALSNQIRAIRPATLAGLAALAKVARFDSLPVVAHNEAEEEMEWDELCLFRFLAEVERLASEAGEA